MKVELWLALMDPLKLVDWLAIHCEQGMACRQWAVGYPAIPGHQHRADTPSGKRILAVAGRSPGSRVLRGATFPTVPPAHAAPAPVSGYFGVRSSLTVAGAVTALAPFGSSAPCSLLIPWSPSIGEPSTGQHFPTPGTSSRNLSFHDDGQCEILH